MKNTTKFAVKWLDTLTAWAFVVGLACWSYDLFMVQLPEEMFSFRLNADYPGDAVGMLFAIGPSVLYGLICGSVKLETGWWMILRLHTRLIIPTLLCYFSAYLRYTCANDFFEGDLLLSIPFIFLLFFIVPYFIRDVEKLVHQQFNGGEHNNASREDK